SAVCHTPRRGCWIGDFNKIHSEFVEGECDVNLVSGCEVRVLVLFSFPKRAIDNLELVCASHLGHCCIFAWYAPRSCSLGAWRRSWAFGLCLSLSLCDMRAQGGCVNSYGCVAF